ncbi:patatin-like phospholipase family protein [Fodinicola feengrottensis]|uniref:patatin-like phospholipase family protein n=1 Tax=Fodinicola feengrottensis TaxID=435914 RepID=UPI0013D22766|nr:patatin-like phospholipase family protein [Fodinicola feengrottensis]
MTAPPSPRRALIMAGGGLKVAYQAGVLQVWLDEAELDFDLADGASGGVLNLAMWCQGMTGTQIADNWRAYHPLRAGTPNVRGWLRGPYAPSLLTLSGMKNRVLPGFGLDWHAIRSTRREATFNLFNVSRQEHQVLPAARMTDDLLLSGIALPMWFPPVRVDGDTYIDSVFATDANLEETVRRGATELWVIWTVSTRGQWRPGFVSEYFTMIEAAANSRLRASLDRIERSNAALTAGKPSEFGHKVTVHLLAAEVPLHYLLNFRKASFAEAVDLGVRDARAWCAKRGIPVRTKEFLPQPAAVDSVSFHEVMTGTISRNRAPAGQSAKMTWNWTWWSRTPPVSWLIQRTSRPFSGSYAVLLLVGNCLFGKEVSTSWWTPGRPRRSRPN